MRKLAPVLDATPLFWGEGKSKSQIHRGLFQPPQLYLVAVLGSQSSQHRQTASYFQSVDPMTVLHVNLVITENYEAEWQLLRPSSLVAITSKRT